VLFKYFVLLIKSCKIDLKPIQALNSNYSGLDSLTLLRCAIAQTSAITFSSDAFTVMRTNGELSDSLRSIQSLRVMSRIIVETMPWDPFAG